ncbi:MAG: DUF1273 family protein [Clostridia bacterium]|nr:DUF1273 family protein [Clostridia bacterium]
MMTCAFTGHRKIEQDHLAKLPDMLYRAINYAYGRGCRRFIAGGAIGFDTEAAKQVIRYRISHPDVSLAIYVPHIDQSERWSARQKEIYDYILSEANEVLYVSETYDSDCMRRRNKAMAEACDIMIAYVSNSRSGSAQTARMAEALGKEVYNIYSSLME